MNHPIRLKTTAPPLLITLALLCFGLLPRAQAVVPAPDGGYPGGNTAEGQEALFGLITGTHNTAVGWFSLRNNFSGSFNTAIGAGTLFANTADANTATGAGALLSNGTGTGNTANGAFTLFSNTIGGGNTAVGESALFSNITGDGNTAIGSGALFLNTTGGDNTANGSGALFFNTTGGDNTATGSDALNSNTTGFGNTASGAFALQENTTGHNNTAIGIFALHSNTTGIRNTASGIFALGSNTIGGDNTAIGDQALVSNTSGNNNTAMGNDALNGNTIGNANTAVGFSAGSNVSTADNVICIGTDGANVDDSCYIGNIWNQSGGSQAVYVNSLGKLGAQVSSRRFKDEIKPMEQTSEVIYGLRPVSFRYKAEIEPSRPLSFGLVAEDVEKIAPNLVTRGSDGKVNSVRYEAVNAMLLNEFLKARRQIDAQQKQIEALTAGLQKVSAQLEASKPAPQMVNNP